MKSVPAPGTIRTGQHPRTQRCHNQHVAAGYSTMQHTLAQVSRLMHSTGCQLLGMISGGPALVVACLPPRIDCQAHPESLPILCFKPCSCVLQAHAGRQCPCTPLARPARSTAHHLPRRTATGTSSSSRTCAAYSSSDAGSSSCKQTPSCCGPAAPSTAGRCRRGPLPPAAAATAAAAAGSPAPNLGDSVTSTGDPAVIPRHWQEQMEKAPLGKQRVLQG